MVLNSGRRVRFRSSTPPHMCFSLFLQLTHYCVLTLLRFTYPGFYPTRTVRCTFSRMTMKTSAMRTLWYCDLVDVYDPVQVLSITCVSLCSFKVASTLPQPLCGTGVVPIILPENPAECRACTIDVLRSFLEDEPPPLILEHDDDDQPSLGDHFVARMLSQ